MKIDLDLLVKISREIACGIFDVLRQNFMKHSADIDRIAERAAIELLEEKGYAANMFSEEAGHFCVGENPQFTLALDPLDGSVNYLADIPVFAVSVAISARKSAYKLSDVDVATVKTSFGKEYVAKKGQGMRVNEEHSVSEKDYELVRVPYLNRIPFHPVHYRMFGASALELCLIAEGSLTIFVDDGTLKATDIAGAQLMIEESGGKITDLRGNNLGNALLRGRRLSVLAATSSQIHSRFLEFFHNSYSKQEM